MMKVKPIFWILILAASFSYAGIDDHQVNSFDALAITVAPQNLIAGNFSQSIDHATNSATFNQRYWINSDYAKSADAPVILHICGEGNAEQGYFLNDNAVAWAKALGARVVYLEHRYYGKSLPFADLSNEHMQYLTLDNVIEDLASFQKWISANKGWTGKWISVGGSYSGTISAIYRQKHPELVVGALASSAPMISGIGDPISSSYYIQYLSSITPSVNSSARQWAYQSCTTFGFWKATGYGYNSSLQSPSAWLCQQVFGNAPFVDSHQYNQNYDQPFISNDSNAPSNILFTYGGDDVWTKLGLLQQSNANPNITIQLIEKAGHHEDLNPPQSSDSQQIVAARNLFLTFAKKWLEN